MFINKQKRLKDLDMKIVHVFPQCIYSKYYAYNFTVFALAFDSSSLLSSFKLLKSFNFLVNLALALQCSISVHYDIKRNENFFSLIRLFNPKVKFTQIFFFFLLQNFGVDLFSRRGEVQKLREDKFSQIGENSEKSVKINPREN